ncbi:hypothetical protein J2Y88_000657 [Pseudomonas chlororaphis]|uniref:hypothetical protein n=1 Tax=Pseudomonas chlororaphis TaxID=587753 RepID=UPI00209E5B27|nr:hypothetical protein [Pseudomonas chlororaphis]MCP1478346.1 hypothetical protein [Pseudomonas chlororaphis]MCP1595302.1 hypothetical protein [Pseudomonas chlororaphis]
MSKFFEVWDTDGNKRFINSDYVVEMIANDGDWEKGAVLYLSESAPYRTINIEDKEVDYIQRKLEKE